MSKPPDKPITAIRTTARDSSLRAHQAVLTLASLVHMKMPISPLSHSSSSSLAAQSPHPPPAATLPSSPSPSPPSMRSTRGTPAWATSQPCLLTILIGNAQQAESFLEKQGEVGRHMVAVLWAPGDKVCDAASFPGGKGKKREREREKYRLPGLWEITGCSLQWANLSDPVPHCWARITPRWRSRGWHCPKMRS